MKYLVAPSFSNKLAAIDDNGRREASRILHAITSLSVEDLSKQSVGSFIQALGDDIYVLRMGDLRVVATTAPTDDGTALLLLDIIEHGTGSRKGRAYASRDPKTNASFNPRLNSRLNPKLNSSINPKLNSSINPRLNSSINPRLNSSINPRLNSSINPRFNSSINPTFNSSLNPRFNSSINPKFNRTFGGPFVYNNNLEQTSFVVRATDDVILIFDMEGMLKEFGVRNAVEGYALFDTGNEWIGHLVKADDDVFIAFDRQNQQVGIMV